ncbi:50S ribosomal subunit maturation GTPase RbgA [Thermosynechococcus sp. NK55a]|jgi:ribosome biogenesis GTPase A|uniref:ribosome biogenesis GTPase YlqF n=1 Tax=unclassified Thermosynechococcus TaxID=2622553 RepID=UPI0003D8622F|nr:MULTISPECIES: ribosome biogenesis GTPase YlqF [unclassified Thermosynechococcus]AHB88164.1 50S ribosomal subunit maturation GTPase RbgA [Thermosynechococcus sp. NK55a]RMH66504.1 MAG: ribosome biogenesis GTPase YlqF [Cyanobacteria bacterium J003]HIK22855.1 ribosome biogenesis GTPase YlqF [Thermosynechococcus sp. M3746_W2019_013]
MGPIIQWYPGHIAKAERALKEQLKQVDVIFEVRDARIPLASCHPQIRQWASGKQRLLVLNGMDRISDRDRQQWLTWFETQGETVFFTNAQRGEGIRRLEQAAVRAGAAINQRRQQRGMQVRAVRAVVLGFPNVGKSALINRLLRQRVVESAARPGVTRQLRWVRLSPALELLDAPGVLPMNFKNQEAAVKLAICDDIGQAAYDPCRVAPMLVDIMQQLGHADRLRERYGLALSNTGETYLYDLAASRYHGDLERAARQLLQDYRRGYLGAIALEHPPQSSNSTIASS